MTAFRGVLGVLCWFVPGAALALALFVRVAISDGGWWPHLGSALTLYVLFVGDLASMLLNGLYWLVTKRPPTWLGSVLLAQGLCVVAIIWAFGAA